MMKHILNFEYYFILGLHGCPPRNGKVPEITKFDAGFFGVHPKQTDCMDPQLRMLLEASYEAIIDSGEVPFKGHILANTY